ncbi:MAG: hypothetical protein AB7E80_09630 [Hyphomicrobiaceae bacterium]
MNAHKFVLAAAALLLAVPATSNSADAASTTSFRRPGSLVALNPQPLPPRWSYIRYLKMKRFQARRGSDVMLNPQPLPPKDILRLR